MTRAVYRPTQRWRCVPGPHLLSSSPSRQTGAFLSSDLSSLTLSLSLSLSLPLSLASHLHEPRWAWRSLPVPWRWSMTAWCPPWSSCSPTASVLSVAKTLNFHYVVQLFISLNEIRIRKYATCPLPFLSFYNKNTFQFNFLNISIICKPLAMQDCERSVRWVRGLFTLSLRNLSECAVMYSLQSSGTYCLHLSRPSWPTSRTEWQLVAEGGDIEH